MQTPPVSQPGSEPGMLKLIVCGPALPFASAMAWRSDPAPVSLVLVTVNVVARADAAANTSAATSVSRKRDWIRMEPP